MAIPAGLILSACTTPTAASGQRGPDIIPEPTGTPVRGETPGFECRNAALDQFRGRVATSELGTEMLRVSGARSLRWVQPGMAVTMDFRADRLTVHLDAANRVQRAACG